MREGVERPCCLAGTYLSLQMKVEGFPTKTMRLKPSECVHLNLELPDLYRIPDSQYLFVPLPGKSCLSTANVFL